MLPLGLFILFAGAVIMDSGGDDDGVVVGHTDDDMEEPGDETGLEGGSSDDPGDDADEDSDGPEDDQQDSEDNADDAGEGDEEELDLTVTTAPTTGALTITAPEGDTGSLVLIQSEASVGGGQTLETDFESALFYAPEGFDVQTAYAGFDWETFRDTFEAENNRLPTLTEYFAALGLEPIEAFDQGTQSMDDNSLLAQETDTRTLLPEITSNLETEVFLLETTGTTTLSPGAATPFLPLTGVDQAMNFFVSIDTNSGLSGSEVEVENGDTVTGTSSNDEISSPPGDPTSVTIEGGDGQDTIRGGLNDTIVTDDDDEADTILIGAPSSFGQVFDGVPILKAGSEDTVVAEGDGNFVLRFEQDAGNGVTNVFYHVMSSDTALVPPASSLDTNEALTLEEFYARSGWELLAVGSLGSVTTANGVTDTDNLLAPPRFDGLAADFFSTSGGFFSMQIGADGTVTSSTLLSTGWPTLG